MPLPHLTSHPPKKHPSPTPSTLFQAQTSNRPSPRPDPCKPAIENRAESAILQPNIALRVHCFQGNPNLPRAQYLKIYGAGQVMVLSARFTYI